MGTKIERDDEEQRRRDAIATWYASGQSLQAWS